MFFASATQQDGTVVIGHSRLGRIAGLDGDGKLCVLHFTAVGEGNAELRFVRARARDADNGVVRAEFESVGIVISD